MVSRLEKLGHYNILLRTKVYQRLVPRWIIAPHFSRNASIQVTLLTSVRGSDRCPARRLTAMPKGDTEDLFPGALGGTYIEVQILDPSKPSCQQNYELSVYENLTCCRPTEYSRTRVAGAKGT